MENKSKRRVERNDPCPCGSGKKYKKCCLNKDTQPVPPEVIKYFQKIRAEHEYLKQVGIHINYVKPSLFFHSWQTNQLIQEYHYLR